MKKNLLKTIIISTVIILLNIVHATTFAEEDEPGNISTDQADKVRKIFETLNKNSCIQFSETTAETIDPNKDDGYIITFVEEPLSINLGDDADEPGAEFRQRICSRHFFQYSLGNKVENRSELSRISCEDDQVSELKELANESSKTTYSCKPILVLLSRGGTTMLYHYIGMIYRWGVSMVGIIAVLIIVISGIQISMAGGEAEAVTNAKRRIMQSLSGIAVLILSSLILYTINPDFFIR